MVPVFLFLISIPSCTYIFKTLLRIRDPSSVFIPFSEAETKRGACRCAIGAFSFPIGKFIRPPSTRISHFGLFPLHNTFFTAPFRQRNSRSSPRSFRSGSLHKVDHWLSFCWLPPFSLPSCPFCSATPSSSSASSRPRPRPRAFSSSDQNPSNRSRLEGGFTWSIRDPLCTFQKCLGAAPGVNETRR